MGTDEQRFLRALEVEVDVDIAMDAGGTPPADESPAQWPEDPYELEAEATDLRSLRGAIEVLEGGPEDAAGTAVSSG
jgi:hypothetical protein